MMLSHWGLLWLAMWLEIALVLVLVLPLPLAAKRAVIETLSTRVAANTRVRTTLIVLFVITIFLFFEAWNEFSSLSGEYTRSEGKSGKEHSLHVLEDSLSALENLYISGASCFLFIVLYGLSSTMTQLARVESRAAVEQKLARGNQDQFLKVREENDTLKKALADVKDTAGESQRARQSVEVLQKQALSQQSEYLRVLAQNSELEKTIERLRDQLTHKSEADKKYE